MRSDLDVLTSQQKIVIVWDGLNNVGRLAPGPSWDILNASEDSAAK